MSCRRSILFLLLLAGSLRAQWTPFGFARTTVDQILWGAGGSLLVKTGFYLHRCERMGGPWIPADLGVLVYPEGKLISAQGSAVFVRGPGGLFGSLENNGKWALVRGDSSGRILDPIGWEGGLLWAANRAVGVDVQPLFSSPDLGKTWISHSNGLGAAPLCLATFNDQIHLGTDQGVYVLDASSKAWKPLLQGLTARVQELVPLRNGLYASTGKISSNTAQILTSIYVLPSGKSAWEPVKLGSYLTTLAIADYKGILVRGSFGGGVDFYDESGKTWQSTGMPPSHSGQSLAVKGDTLLVGEEAVSNVAGSGGIYLWRLGINGISSPKFSASRVFPHPGMPGLFFLGQRRFDLTGRNR